MNKEQITLWLSPVTKKETEYGRITNREWLHAEQERMSKSGQEFFIGKAGKSGLLALFRRVNERGFDYEKRITCERG